jgi:hypothetical protein
MTQKRLKKFFGPKMTFSENIGRPVRPSGLSVSIRLVRQSPSVHPSFIRPYPHFILTRSSNQQFTEQDEIIGLMTYLSVNK